MPRQLPARPNLEQLKKQAKSLLRAAQARDDGRAPPVHRVAAFSSTSIERIDAPIWRSMTPSPCRARARVPVLDGAA